MQRHAALAEASLVKRPLQADTQQRGACHPQIYLNSSSAVTYPAMSPISFYLTRAQHPSPRIPNSNVFKKPSVWPSCADAQDDCRNRGETA